ncbi:MAG: bifunctional adenosylcobinamide kinase/adenosylcobinamide-phosphate guanylyltransferase [Syntrophomonas sp.]
MARVIMVLGGSSSGKSEYAEEITASLEAQLGGPVYYLATARVIDEELAGRVERHRLRRPFSWSTIEEPLNLAAVLPSLEPQPLICLVDGVGTWISNILIESLEPDKAWDARAELDCLQKIYDFIEALKEIDGAIVIVADEVGWDLLPVYKLGRVFMELNGLANQILAEASTDLVFVTSGTPVFVKGGISA